MAALLEPRGGSSRTICCHALLDIFSRLMPALLQLQGGGLVPLSHAICCRPCLPEELPDSGGRISPDDKGVAIVSIGCHAATGELCRSAPAGRWAIEPHTCNSACGQEMSWGRCQVILPAAFANHMLCLPAKRSHVCTAKLMLAAAHSQSVLQALAASPCSVSPKAAVL